MNFIDGRAAGTGKISSQNHFQLIRLWLEQISSKTSRRPTAEQEEFWKPPNPRLKTVMKTIHPPRWHCIKKTAGEAAKNWTFWAGREIIKEKDGGYDARWWKAWHQNRFAHESRQPAQRSTLPAMMFIVKIRTDKNWGVS